MGASHPANNTVVPITGIGNHQANGGDPLVCATQRTPCCAIIPDRFGDWFYPNETVVPINGAGASLYRTRRDSDSANNVLGGALLNRRFDVMGPTGIYHCVIPGADDINQCFILDSTQIQIMVSKLQYNFIILVFLIINLPQIVLIIGVNNGFRSSIRPSNFCTDF